MKQCLWDLKDFEEPYSWEEEQKLLNNDADEERRSTMKPLMRAYDEAKSVTEDSVNCLADNLDKLMDYPFTLGKVCAFPFMVANKIMDAGIGVSKLAYRKLRKEQPVNETPHDEMMNWLAARGVDFSHGYYNKMGDVEFAQTVYDAYVALHG